MTASQQQALVSLLQDGDAATVGLVKGQLIQGGDARLAEYTELLRSAAGSGQGEPAGSHPGNRSVADARGCFPRPGQAQDVEPTRDALLGFHPHGPSRFRGRTLRAPVGPMGRRRGQLITPKATSREKVHCLARYLGQDRASAAPAKTTIIRATATCRGPWNFVAACRSPSRLIYILVGMRLNIPVEGIAAPGHFLARLDGIIFDPYRQGRILSDGEWEMIASEVP